jgi:hypothetical protein
MEAEATARDQGFEIERYGMLCDRLGRLVDRIGLHATIAAWRLASSFT